MSAPPDPDLTLPPPDAGGVTEPAVQGGHGLPRAAPNYEILGELGRGGMGVVYQARQRGLNRLVALKMILAGGHAGAADLERFRLEAETLARLHHPNVVQVYDVGEWDGSPYFSLEYCPGGSLAQQLAGTPIAPGRAAALVETLARAVEATHRVGVIHRDLKPANVLFGEDGTPKVTDFGLAKKAGASDGPTLSGTIMGTPSYMAPEQAGGKTGELGPAVDVYALGAILYECLTGRPPFRAATPLDTIMQVLSDEPVAPRSLNPALPRDLETVALKCLRKDPRHRYASAAALADDLRAFAEGLPIQARPIGPLARAARWTRRRPTQAALVLACLLLVGVGLGAVAWNWRASVRARLREQEQRQAVEAALERARHLLYANSLSRAEEAWRDSDTTEARGWLAGVPEDLRGWEWHYARRLYQGDLLTLRGHADAVTSVACSADGRRIASGSADRTVRVWDARDGRLLHTLAGHGGPVTAVAFAPDGTLASAGRDGRAILWDASRGTALRTPRGPGPALLAAAFSPDGARLATAGEDRLAVLHEVATGKKVLELAGHDHFVTGVAFHPREPWLATSSADNVVRVWDLEAPARQLVLRGHTSEVRGVAFRPDGGALASASWDKLVKLWDPRGGRHLRDLVGHTQGAYAVAFSPDGRRLASASGDRTARLWDPATGADLLVLPGHSHYVTAVAFGHDGRRLVVARNDRTVKVWDLTRRHPTMVLAGSAGDRADALRFDASGERLAQWRAGGPLRVWDARTGQARGTEPAGWDEARDVPFTPAGEGKVAARPGGEVVVLEARDFEILALAASPDGTRLAAGCGDQTVRLWDARTGQLLLTLRGHGAAVEAVAFCPRGHRLGSRDSDRQVRIWNAEPLDGDGE